MNVKNINYHKRLKIQLLLSIINIFTTYSTFTIIIFKTEKSKR